MQTAKNDVIVSMVQHVMNNTVNAPVPMVLWAPHVKKVCDICLVNFLNCKIMRISRLTFLFLVCEVGYFGQNCTQECDCTIDEPCSHITGLCSCPPGKTGKQCETGTC